MEDVHGFSEPSWDKKSSQDTTRQSKQGKTGTPIRIHIHISSFRQPTLVLVLASWDLEGETSF